ncbi:MAG: hypothetical protein WCO60_10420 [Verrucomicrobiota bacterium]
MRPKRSALKGLDVDAPFAEKAERLVWGIDSPLLNLLPNKALLATGTKDQIRAHFFEMRDRLYDAWGDCNLEFFRELVRQMEAGRALNLDGNNLTDSQLEALAKMCWGNRWKEVQEIDSAQRGLAGITYLVAKAVLIRSLLAVHPVHAGVFFFSRRPRYDMEHLPLGSVGEHLELVASVVLRAERELVTGWEKHFEELTEPDPELSISTLHNRLQRLLGRQFDLKETSQAAMELGVPLLQSQTKKAGVSKGKRMRKCPKPKRASS